ncbi:MAG: hypothetical protein M0C28_41400 [Candidatus Moduliflexus flocculans]|nr:hypothetical protein [Candidatus Moduliflexus flocculans]
MKGCSACGYPSRREFAVAVSKGLAKTEMCHSPQPPQPAGVYSFTAHHQREAGTNTAGAGGIGKRGTEGEGICAGSNGDQPGDAPENPLGNPTGKREPQNHPGQPNLCEAAGRRGG